MLSRSVYFVYHEEHEGLGNYYISISNFVLLCFKICAPRASLMTTQNISDSEIPPAKARKAPSSDNYFLCGLCVFAGDIPNLWLRLCRAGLFATFVVIMSGSILVATSPRWVLRGENLFTVKPEEAFFLCVQSFFTDYKKLEKVFAQRHRLDYLPAK